MILLNFAHPLTDQQLVEIEILAAQKIDQVVDLPVQFDHQQSFRPQVEALMRSLPLDATRLQTEPVVVNLPSLNFIAALLLAELHGRMGYFPSVLRLRPVEGSLPPRYEAAELLNLQEARDHARWSRYER